MKKRFLVLVAMMIVGAMFFSSCSCADDKYTYVAVVNQTDAATNEGFTFWVSTSQSDHVKEVGDSSHFAVGENYEISFMLKENWAEKEGDGFTLEIYHNSVFSLTAQERSTIIDSMEDYRSDRLEDELEKNDDRTEDEIKAAIEEEMQGMEEFSMYFPISVELEKPSDRTFVAKIDSLPHEIGYIVSGIEEIKPVVSFHSTSENLNKFKVTINGEEMVNETNQMKKLVEYSNQDSVIIKIAPISSRHEVPDRIYYYKDGPVEISGSENAYYSYYRYKQFVYENSPYYNLPNRLTLAQLNLVVQYNNGEKGANGEVTFNLGGATGNIYAALSMDSESTFEKIMQADSPSVCYSQLSAEWEGANEIFGWKSFGFDDELQLNVSYYHDAYENYAVLKENGREYEYDFNDVELSFYDKHSGEIIEGVQWRKSFDDEVTEQGATRRKVVFTITPPLQDFEVKITKLGLCYFENNEKIIADISEIEKIYSHSVDDANIDNIVVGYDVFLPFEYAEEKYLLPETSIYLYFYDMEVYDAFADEMNLALIVKNANDEILTCKDYEVYDYEYDLDGVKMEGKNVHFTYLIDSDITISFAQFN